MLMRDFDEALQISCNKSHLNLVTLLIEKGANINAPHMVTLILISD